jgi:hypothetical protein
MGKMSAFVCPLCFVQKTMDVDADEYLEEHKKELPDFVVCGANGCVGLAERVKIEK